MLHVGITLRVQENSSYPERRDCLDQRWALFFEKLGILPIPLLNAHSNPTDYLAALELDGFILSGGNDIGPGGNAPERDCFEAMILQYSRSRELPVIGVCRGMQFLQDFCGGGLVESSTHAGTRHGLEIVSDWASRLPTDVNSYHKFVMQPADVAEGFESLAFAPDGTVEAICDHRRHWLGIMWHPERESTFIDSDLRLFKAWLSRGE